jgi:hypothetical protein
MMMYIPNNEIVRRSHYWALTTVKAYNAGIRKYIGTTCKGETALYDFDSLEIFVSPVK